MEHLREELKESKKEDYYQQMYESEKTKVQDLEHQLQEKQETLAKWSQHGNEDVVKVKEHILELEKALFAARSNADETEKIRRASISYLSNQMMSSLVEAEDQHEKEIKEMRETISQLEQEKKELNVQLHAEERKRKNSNAEVSATMFNKILLSEQDKDLEKKKYEQQIKQLQEQLKEVTSKDSQRVSEVNTSTSVFKSLLEAETAYKKAKKDWERKENGFEDKINRLMEEAVKIKQNDDLKDQQRKESILKLHDDVRKHFVDINKDHEKEMKKMKAESNEYKNELTKLKIELVTQKQQITYLENSKLSIIEKCNQQMNLLRTSVYIMNKQQ